MKKRIRFSKIFRSQRNIRYLMEVLISASEFSDSLSELETVVSEDPIALSKSDVNFCRIVGEQQQHCQPEDRTSSIYSSPIFFLTHFVQNNVLHDSQLNKSLLCPHHPQ